MLTRSKAREIVRETEIDCSAPARFACVTRNARVHYNSLCNSIAMIAQGTELERKVHQPALSCASEPKRSRVVYTCPTLYSVQTDWITQVLGMARKGTRQTGWTTCRTVARTSSSTPLRSYWLPGQLFVYRVEDSMSLGPEALRRSASGKSLLH